MRFAVVGLGYWGPKLLRNVMSLAPIDDVIGVDSDPKRHEMIRRQVGPVACLESLDDALDAGVDAVIIATPLRTHAVLAQRAIDAGTHVLVEKPLAGSVVAAADLVRRASERGVVLMTGHTFLFSPRVEALAKLRRTGVMRRVDYATAQRLNLGIYRHDESVIWDLAPHDLSILFHVLGEFPETVQSAGRGVLRRESLDVAFINLTFPSGAVASVTVSWLAPRKIRHIALVGDTKMVVYDDTDNDEPVKIYDRGLVVPDSASFGEHQLTYRFGETVAPYIASHEPLARELVHFVDCIEGEEECISDGLFGLRVVEVLEAAELSWRTGGSPVPVARSEEEVIPLLGNAVSPDMVPTIRRLA